MSATREHHIIYPSLDRLKGRLADAEASHLILYNEQFRQLGPLIHEWTALCTPTHDDNPYEVMVRWEPPEDRAYIHCTCIAGYYGRGCKHAALLLNTLGLLTKDTRFMVLDDYAWQQYKHVAILPQWKESEDDTQKTQGDREEDNR